MFERSFFNLGQQQPEGTFEFARGREIDIQLQILEFASVDAGNDILLEQISSLPNAIGFGVVRGTVKATVSDVVGRTNLPQQINSDAVTEAIADILVPSGGSNE